MSASQQSRSSCTQRPAPSGPPMRTDGMRPVLAASYSRERDTPTARATSADATAVQSTCSGAGSGDERYALRATAGVDRSEEWLGSPAALVVSRLADGRDEQ